MLYDLKEFTLDIEVTRIANIHYFEFTNNYHTITDVHNFCELIYVDNGKISVKSDNFSGVLKKNQIIIHKPMENHMLFCKEEAAPDVIIIGFECGSAAIEKFSRQPYTLPQSLQKILAEIVKESRNVFMPPYDIPNQPDMKKYEGYPFGSDQLIKNLLEYLLIKLVREGGDGLAQKQPARVSNALVDEVCAYIDKNYLERFSINQLCLLFNTNRATLCSLFKKHTGKTIVGYASELKIKEAKRLMRADDKSFTEISEQLNFSSVHYFCKFFTKTEKMTPSTYITTVKAKLNH